MRFRCRGVTRAAVRCRRRVARRGGVCGFCRPPSQTQPTMPAVEICEPSGEPADDDAAKVLGWFEARGDAPASSVYTWPHPIPHMMLFDFLSSHPGWWVWPDRAGFRRDSAEQADSANSRILKRLADDGYRVAGAVVAYPDSGPESAIGYVGVGRLTRCCRDQDISGIPWRPEQNGWMCPGCGSYMGPEFRFEAPVEEIRLCDDPDVALTAAPGPQALTDMFYSALAEARQEAISEACERLSGGVSKLADPGFWRPEKWEWCENPGTPTADEIAEAVEGTLLEAGIRNGYYGSCEPLYGRCRWGNPDVDGIGYDVGFLDLRGEWTGDEIWFHSTGPCREDIDGFMTTLAEERNALREKADGRKPCSA